MGNSSTLYPVLTFRPRETKARGRAVLDALLVPLVYLLQLLGLLGLVARLGRLGRRICPGRAASSWLWWRSWLLLAPASSC